MICTNEVKSPEADSSTGGRISHPFDRLTWNWTWLQYAILVDISTACKYSAGENNVTFWLMNVNRMITTLITPTVFRISLLILSARVKSGAGLEICGLKESRELCSHILIRRSHQNLSTISKVPLVSVGSEWERDDLRGRWR